MKTFAAFLSSFFLIFMLVPAQAQPGSLDETFGNGGTITIPAPDDELSFTGLIQPDGKILLAGYQEINNSRNFYCARYNSDGFLDTGFGNQGILVFDGGTDSDAIWAIALQDDEKILLGGSVYYQFTSVDDFSLIRTNEQK